MERLREFFSPENVLSYTLGFVMAWFGAGEVFAPSDWSAFAPGFLGGGKLVLMFVVGHGLLLALSALFLFLNHYRKIGALIIVVLLTEIVVNLIAQTGLTDIAIRDIGLWGAGLALFLMYRTWDGNSNETQVSAEV